MRQKFPQLIVLQVISNTTSGEEVANNSEKPMAKSGCPKTAGEKLLACQSHTPEETCYLLKLGLAQK